MDGINALLLSLKQYSVVFMLVVFVLLLATVLWPGRGRRFEQDARIPLDDDETARPARDQAAARLARNAE